MIDYEKLRVAHEILDTVEGFAWINTNYSCISGTCEYTLTLGLNPNKEDIFHFDDIDDLIEKLEELTHPNPKYAVGQEVFVRFGDDIHQFKIDEIIHDDGFWYLHYISDGGEGEFHQYREDIIYPSREALIDAQINYWTGLRTPIHSKVCPKCGEKRVADGMCWAMNCDYKECDHKYTFESGFACEKCGENRYRKIREIQQAPVVGNISKESAQHAAETVSKICRKNEEKSTHEEDMSKASACVHENDGLCHNMRRSPDGTKWDSKCKHCGEFYR